MGSSDGDLSRERVVEILNNSFSKGKNQSVSTLSGGDGPGKILSWDDDRKELVMQFMGTDAMCNGKPGPKAQVQGGFACAMLDAVTAQTVVVYSKLTRTVATLEQKCKYWLDRVVV
mmetsp:Transcript_27222/g.43761  ORF Transcript_27222/g.43761 Transcript_27222/m.43761 type:complete len:116 (+) Transcript_27222:348-695(+)